MFPHYFLTLQATWRLGGRHIRSERRRSNRRASIAWIRVHAIARSNTCLKYILSELIAGHIFGHVDASWASDLRRAEDHAISIGRPRDRAIEAVQSTWLHRSNGHIAGAYVSDLTARRIPIREDRWSVGFRSSGVCSVWKNSTIAARSNRDHGSIEPQSRRVRRGIVAGRTDGDRRRVSTTIDARSRPDRGAIVAEIAAKIVAKVKRNWSWNQADSSRIWSHDPCPKNRLHDAWKPLPRMLQLATIFVPISPLKTHVVLLCSLTFDRLVKKLSEFRGRS